ncbi:MAG: DNA photolyase family protein [Gammaproteobacteria bacterium]|nr:DNA photolyase family protein [Gammaproteobacteria bacterium]
MNTLIWFQRDLRIKDNLALNWALRRGNPIIAIFIHNPDEDVPWQTGAASSWWLHHSLKSLTDDLSKHGIQLHCFKANSQQKIRQLVSSYHINAVTWTNRHEPKRIQYENAIEAMLLKKNITVKRVKDELLQNYNAFLTKTHKTPYKVFTPFYKRLRQELSMKESVELVTKKQWQACSKPVIKTIGSELKELSLLTEHRWHEKLSSHWTPGEKTASEKLNQLISHTLINYSIDRDYPKLAGTSSLSPHLHFGEISPQQILNALLPYLTFFSSNKSNNAESFLRQLIWRDFARYILWNFPDTATQAMNKKFKQNFWKFDEEKLHKWQQGQTGIPIIDAGMKQLWETGWMHNRVRMLSASFLTKNLGIPWQEGAQWFWKTLVDADLANNSMGWQWVAGCGVDAAPYFRIFNPYTQTQRFDKDQCYIKQWLDLKNTEINSKAIIDIKQSRANALLRYQRLILEKTS